MNRLLRKMLIAMPLFARSSVPKSLFIQLGLAMRSMRWRDSTPCVAPSPHSRRTVGRHPWGGRRESIGGDGGFENRKFSKQKSKVCAGNRFLTPKYKKNIPAAASTSPRLNACSWYLAQRFGQQHFDAESSASSQIQFLSSPVCVHCYRGFPRSLQRRRFGAIKGHLGESSKWNLTLQRCS